MQGVFVNVVRGNQWTPVPQSEIEKSSDKAERYREDIEIQKERPGSTLYAYQV